MTNLVKISKKLTPPTDPGRYFRLICLTGEKKGYVYILKGKRIVLGRGQTSHIQIMDGQSSREHFELVLVGDNYILTDLGSQNGVVVNDFKVKQHKLSNGDKIIVGQTVYKYSVDTVKPEFKEEIDEEVEDSEQLNKKKSPVKILILLAAIILAYFFLADGPTPKKVTKKYQEVVEKKEQDNSPKVVNESENTYLRFLHRGKREYREGNYFRAIKEFEEAEKIKWGDGTVAFNIQKAKQKIDELISESLLAGKREIESLRYASAQVSYCKVIKLLQYRPEDERRKEAEIQIDNLEMTQKLTPGTIHCYDGHKRGGDNEN